MNQSGRIPNCGTFKKGYYETEKSYEFILLIHQRFRRNIFVVEHEMEKIVTLLIETP